MKTYASYGHKEFILCLGYKGDYIRNYFANYRFNTSDTTIRLDQDGSLEFHNPGQGLDWSITLAETGQESMTAYRIKLIEKYLGEDQTFLLTYGDGVSNVDVNAAITQHENSDYACTLAAVHPPGRFGELGISGSGVTSFNEKPQTEASYINGGYMVCNRDIFNYLPEDPGMMLEQSPMRDMVKDGKLGVFKHGGFWQPMDTYAEFTYLNRIWNENQAPWKIW